MTQLKQAPLVSIICICYNQEAYVEECLQSVLDQTYTNVELIIVDDASVDNSTAVIQKYLTSSGCQAKFLSLEQNQGHCHVFNLALEHASGKYMIDLAADDILLKDRIAEGVDRLESVDEEYGVHFADAELIDDQSQHKGYHITQSYFPGREVPQGFIFHWLLKRYFINPPTMMYKRSLLDQIGGYDASLYYEDFDFWIRSSAVAKYCFSPNVLVKKRIHGRSKSAGQYTFGSKMLSTTYIVCCKALDLCRSKEDYEALLTRVDFEQKKALFSLNLNIWISYRSLRKRIRKCITMTN